MEVLHVVFLSSRLPLTKTFAQTNGVLAATPYPLVSKVTSHHETASSLEDFYKLLVDHAAAGHCLFRGQLTRPLKSESRAGLTDKDAPHHWVVFDFDKVPARDAAEVVKTYLPAECQNVSYIAQLSASMFRPDNTTWSGHIFMLLKEPIGEQRLRQWFEYLNFTVPALAEQLRLSDSEQSLRWPLDRTVAYSSKLIFIAPPKCYGFTPAIDKPITLVKKRQPRLKIPEFTPITHEQIRDKINELRRSVGLDEITYSTTPFEGHYVLDSSDPVTVHDIKTSGDHYIRFNLNGGDSYAYFIDLRRPELIRNFKGEPYLKTQDAAPELWKSLRKVAPRAVARTALDEGVEILAFYATNQSSAVKIGQYDHGTQTLQLHNSSERAAKAWLQEFGIAAGGMLPHMDIVFDPHCDVQYVTGATQINQFKATKYMLMPKTDGKKVTTADVPPVFDKCMRSMLGNPTEEHYAHFLNWLAYIFQFRKKTTTAWVLSGTEGTGKGTFVKYLLKPLFGPENVSVVQYGLLNQEYNGWLEHALFVVFEEADINGVDNQAALGAKLRHYIADDPIEIRKMRTDPYPAPNYANFFFMSNKRTAVQVPKGDRRFNIAEWQDKRWYPTPNELRTLQHGLELEAMADVLLHWPVDELKVTQLIETETRAAVHESTTTINQQIADAIMQGNLQFFLDRIPSDTEAAADFFNKFNPIGMYRAQLDRYIAEAAEGRKSLLRDEDLFVLFRTLIPDQRFFQDSKTWRKRHYKSLGIDVDKQVRDPNNWEKRVRGLLVEWKLPEGATVAKPTDKVVPIKKGKKGKKASS